MKILLATIILLITSKSFASFNRVWVGFKKQNVSSETFIEGLNTTFFSDTIHVGANKGLLSYQPYITKMTGGIPDEIALVIYETEEKYKAIRSTPEGKKYSDLHWDFFEKEVSKSTVSEPFHGELKENSAFELNPNFQDWQKGNTEVIIYTRDSNIDLMQLAQSFNSLKKDKNINNSILLVINDWIIEYRSTKSGSSKKLPLPVIESNQLPTTTVRDRKTLGISSGLNFLF